MFFSEWEVGPIRPPSEAGSLLIRVTRNCPWNKCEFCPIYKNHPFEKREIKDILADIDQAASCGSDYRFAFLQDANSLILKTDDLIRVIAYLKKKFPHLERITSYARARTVARKSAEDLKRMQQAGLTRLHIGLESGYDALLEYMQKGVSSDLAIEAGKKIMKSGISLCFYVILGLGGKLVLEDQPAWKKHALETARVLNGVDPHFIRVRTLTVRKGSPLFDKMVLGEFEMSSDADTVREEEMLLEKLDVHSRFVSDHATNVLMDIEGKLPEAKESLLSLIRKYLALSEQDQLNFRIGTLFRYMGATPHYRSFSHFLHSPEREILAATLDDMEAKEAGSARRLKNRLNSTLV